jgi:transcription termination/antitermination protein NusA
MTDVHNSEILQIIESVAKEKGLAREPLIVAMEQAVQVAARRKYGNEENIKAEINRKTGEIKLYRVLTVVDVVSEDNYLTELALEDAIKKKPDSVVGDEIYELLPPIDLGRVAAQTAKQVIVQRVSEVEREKQYHDFKNREGEILTGIVKRLEFGNIIVDLGRVEGIIKKDQLIKNESYKINDRIKAYVQSVRHEAKGPQVFLSRTDDQILAKLFAMEVPEIYDGVIEVKAIARDPGSKSKIAVFAPDTSVDPLGSCVGLKGNRVRSVTAELNGEKIDVILWSKNLAQFVINAMTPVSAQDISKILIDSDNNRVEIVVADDKLSIAIGRRGQNVRLASKLVGCKIDIMTEEQQSKKRGEEFTRTTALFIEALDSEEMIAELLSSEGYSSIEEIANSEVSTLAAIEGFSEELGQEIKDRAVNYVSAKNEEIVTKLEQLGVEQNLLDILNLQPEDILVLAEYGIKTLEDLAEISVKEFKTVVPNANLSDNEMKQLIDYASSRAEAGAEHN